MPFETMINYGSGTAVAIFEHFADQSYTKITQTDQYESVMIENPIDQKMFITVETLNSRLKPNGCVK